MIYRQSRIRACATAMILFLGLVGPAGGADLGSAAVQIRHAIKAAEQMIQMLQDEQKEGFLREGGAFTEHAKAAEQALTGSGPAGEEVAGHLRAAVAEAEEALKHGGNDQMEMALDRAYDALSHAEEANSLIGSVLPPGGSSS